MVKASFELPNGTVVRVEGSTEDVQQLLGFYGGTPTRAEADVPRKKSGKSGGQAPLAAAKADSSPDLPAIVALVKDSEEAEAIETQILDRSSQVDRTLLPLYIVHEHLNNAFGLTSGEVSKVTTDLGIPISQPNASRTLSGTASKYVIGDKVKSKGQTVRYKLSRRGVKYLKDVLTGTPE